MSEIEYEARDLVAATAGIMQAYLAMSKEKDKYDEETVRAIIDDIRAKQKEYNLTNLQTIDVERYEQ